MAIAQPTFINCPILDNGLVPPNALTRRIETSNHIDFQTILIPKNMDNKIKNLNLKIKQQNTFRKYYEFFDEVMSSTFHFKTNIGKGHELMITSSVLNE